MHRSKSMAFILFFLVSSLYAEHQWNAKSYSQNSNSQQTAALKVLEKYKFRGDERVLDVGCGDGKITAMIREKVPQGSVVGADLSPSMIEFANSTYAKVKGLKFEVKDGQQLNYDSEFNIVVSFNALHWMPNQEAALHGIYHSLKPGGHLVFTIPAGYPSCLANATDALMKDVTWKGYYQNFSTGQRFPSVQEYRTLLKHVGFVSVDVDRSARFDQFSNAEAFKSFVRQWLPHLKPIPANKKDAYMNALMEHYLTECPADNAGRVEFKKYDVSGKGIKPKLSM